MVGTARLATSSAGGPGDDYKPILILTMKILIMMALKMMSYGLEKCLPGKEMEMAEA